MAIVLKRYSKSIKSHKHDHQQWVFPLKGELEIIVCNEKGIVSKDTAVFIPPNEIHKFHSESDNAFIVVNTDKRYSRNNTLNVPPFWKLSSAFNKLISFTQEHLKIEGVHHSHVEAIYMELIHDYFNINLDKKISHAKAWLCRNYNKVIDIKMLARECHLSSSQLQRRFKIATGETIGKYWLSLKMQEAKKLLLTSDATVQEISFELGYENQSSFARQFFKQFKVSPKKFRSMHVSV